MVENTFSTELLEGRPLESTIMEPGNILVVSIYRIENVCMKPDMNSVWLKLRKLYAGLETFTCSRVNKKRWWETEIHLDRFDKLVKSVCLKIPC